MDSEIVITSLNWKSFLEKFSSKQCEILLQENKKKLLSFQIKNILGTNINASNQYGFISLNFKNHFDRDEFLFHANINLKIEDLVIKSEFKDIFNLKWKEVNTNWFSDKKPSRIYVSNGGTGRILSFYDIKNDISNEEISNNRIATFKNIFTAIVNLKITDAEKSLKDDIIK